CCGCPPDDLGVVEVREMATDEQLRGEVLQLQREVAQLYHDGRFRQATEVASQVCEMTRRHFGEDHVDHACALNNLALVLCALGQYSQAELPCRRALEIRRKVLWQSHPDIANSLNNMAAIHESRGEYASAESLLRQALEIREVLF